MMNSNAVIAQRYGNLAVAPAAAQSSPYAVSDDGSSDSNEYDAAYGFSRFGNTSYRKITFFSATDRTVHTTNGEESGLAATSSLPIMPEANSPSLTKSPSSLPFQTAAAPHVQSPQQQQQPIYLPRTTPPPPTLTLTNPKTAVQEPREEEPRVDSPPTADFATLVHQSKGILAEANRLCVESRKNRETKRSCTPTTTAVGGSSLVSSFQPAPSPITERHAESDAPALSTPEDPKQIMIFVSPDPHLIMERRLSRRPTNATAQSEYLLSSNSAHVAEFERGNGLQRSSPSGRHLSAKRKTQAKQAPAPAPAPAAAVNVLSVDSFAHLLDKLSQFMNQSQQREGDSVLQPERPLSARVVRGTKPLQSQRPAVSTSAISTPRIRNRELASKQRADARRSSGGPHTRFSSTALPCYALPTENWLQKQKERDASLGGVSYGSGAGASGFE